MYGQALGLPGGGLVVGGDFVVSLRFGATEVCSTGEPDEDIYLGCLDATGTAKWLVRAGGAMLDALEGLAQLPDGSILAVGTCGYRIAESSFPPHWVHYRGWGADTLEWARDRLAQANADPVFGAGEPGERTLPHEGISTLAIACYRDDGTLRWVEGILPSCYGGEVVAWNDGSFAVAGMRYGVLRREIPGRPPAGLISSASACSVFLIRYASATIGAATP